jgi:calmodulin
LGAVLEGLGIKTTITELQSIIHEIDYDGNGTISFEEFVDMMYRRRGTFKNEDDTEIIALFRAFDKDNNGLITAEEMREAFAKFNEDFSEEEIEEMIKDADVDGDGLINYEEFVEMLKFEKE